MKIRFLHAACATVAAAGFALYGTTAVYAQAGGARPGATPPVTPMAPGAGTNQGATPATPAQPGRPGGGATPATPATPNKPPVRPGENGNNNSGGTGTNPGTNTGTGSTPPPASDQTTGGNQTGTNTAGNSGTTPATPAQPGVPGSAATPATPATPGQQGRNPLDRDNDRDRGLGRGQDRNRDRDRDRDRDDFRNNNGNANANNNGNTPLTGQARPLFTGLQSLNLQNLNLQSLTVSPTTLNNNQLGSLLQALNSNPRVQQIANTLTQELRQAGRIGQNQQVVGVENGRVFIANNQQIAQARGAGSNGIANGNNNGNMPLTGQARPLFTGLQGLNLQNVNLQSLTTSPITLNNTQLGSLLQAFNSNPQAQQTANTLTQELRQAGRIGQDQQVVGFSDGRVFIASNQQISQAHAPGIGVGNAATGTIGTSSAGVNQAMTPQAMAMMNSLVGLNLQTFNPQAVLNVNTVLNQNQVNALMRALNSSPQAQRVAQALTQRLRANGQIAPNQEVVGFQDGRVFVTTINR